jgi:hypothetical protein
MTPATNTAATRKAGRGKLFIEKPSSVEADEKSISLLAPEERNVYSWDDSLSLKLRQERNVEICLS